MMALIIPWLLALLVILAVVSLISKKWKVALLLAGVILLLNWLYECIPIRLWRLSDSGSGVKIICFNIDGATGDVFEKAHNVREILKKYSPDIVFIAEFNEWAPNTMDSLLSRDYKYTTSLLSLKII